MMNVGHSTTTKKICVFFLVISLQLVEFGEGRFERKENSFKFLNLAFCSGVGGCE